MNKILKTLIIGIAASSLAVASFAQTAGPNNPPAQNKTADHLNQRQTNMQILAQLNLTKDQKAKLKAHAAKMKEQVKALKDELKNNTDKSVRRKKMADLRQQNLDDLKTILTDDQFKKYQDLMAQAREKAKEARKNHAHGTTTGGGTGTGSTTGSGTTGKTGGGN